MRAASALALALVAALWHVAARAQAAATLASAALTGASTTFEGVVVPALQFAARGPRGVQERSTYARYIARGPYAVGWRNLPAVPKTDGDWSWEVLSSLASGSTFSTTFPARLYYPAAFNGRNAPLASGRTPLPLLGFAVGWTCDASMYTDILSHLASHGFVVVVPLFNDAASQPLVQVNFRSQLSQLLSLLAFVGAQGRAGAGPAFGDATAGSWAGRVDASRFALAGHSAGGGVALQGAAEAGRRISAVATLGAWANIATTPWLSSLPSTVTAPALLLSGEWDEHAPLAENGQRVYDLLTSPKLLPVIAGGSHCFLDWTAASDGAPLLGLLPWYGYSSCPASQVAALPPPVGRGGTGMRDQILLAQTHLAAFFRLYMLNDTDAAPLVWGDAMRDNSWWSSVQLAPGASLSAQPAEVEAAKGENITLQAALSNLGVSAGNWSLTATAFIPAEPNATVTAADDAAANASVAGLLREQLSPAAPAPAASGLRLRLSDTWVALDADADSAARQRSAASLPRVPTLSAALAAFRRPPPPPAPARRLLLQLPPSSPASSAGSFSLEIDASQAAPGNHTVLLSARSLVDGGSTCYTSIAVRVPAGVGLAPSADGAAAAPTGVAPLVSALAGAASAQMGRLAAALAAPAPPTVSALAGIDTARLFYPKALGAAAAAAASEALSTLARTAATLPPQPTPRDALQALAMQLLQALPAGLNVSALGGAAGAALAALRSALLIRVGFGALVPPPPRPPPPPPPATPPPPPTALSAAADFLRGLDRLLHP